MLRKENTGLVVVDVQVKLARLVHDSKVLIANCVFSWTVANKELGVGATG